MKNVDVEVYMSNLISFFEKNLKEVKDIVLSKEQIVNIVVELKIPDMKYNNLDKIIQKTKFGDIILN
jgi:hypothetical protein